MEADDAITCRYQTVTLHFGVGGALWRDVHYMTADGEPPSSGAPLAILFQGSFFSAERMWSAHRGDSFGGYHQTELVRSLLEAGFVVLAPETMLDGGTFWQTNVVPYAQEWNLAADHELMLAIFAAIDAGTFGPIDATKFHAAGISSGGYMTSRMAIAYPGQFKALAIQSASYATCSGFLCDVPDDLPADHPPVLFLHGEADDIVPVDTMRDYDHKLKAIGASARVVTKADVGHEWLDITAIEIERWFRDN